MEIYNKIMDSYAKLRQEHFKKNCTGNFNVVIEMHPKRFIELKYELAEEGRCVLYEEISDNIVWFIKLCRKKDTDYYKRSFRKAQLFLYEIPSRLRKTRTRKIIYEI